MSVDSLPKISIVTPSFNQGEFIEETIKSVIGQGYGNLEYVVIDGGSKDNSVEIIRRYEKHLHYWVSEEDSGHGHALNKGFEKTTGEIMAWINSDDKYTPWAFNTVAEIFTLFPHVEWIVGINAWFNKNGSMIRAKREPKNIYDFLIGNGGWVQQESVFWRRNLWDKAGGYISQNYKFMVDGELWTRFFLHADLYSVESILGGYRSHASNRAGLNWQQCLSEMEFAIKSMKNDCTKDVIDNFKKLFILKWINKHLFFGQKFLPKMTNRFHEYAKYKNINYKNEQWQERKLKFYY